MGWGPQLQHAVFCKQFGILPSLKLDASLIQYVGCNNLRASNKEVKDCNNNNNNNDDNNNNNKNNDGNNNDDNNNNSGAVYCEQNNSATHVEGRRIQFITKHI